jgi:dTDP-4-dehydrorhamnose 3,5-epimerase-like enzyme
LGIEECKLVELPVVEDPQGNLAFAEGGRHVPFEIVRVFYVYDVPEGAVRGGHAHASLKQVVFCLAGDFEIVVDDGSRQRPFRMEERRTGLYLPPMIWHDMVRFAPGSAYVVLTSAPFDEADYIRERDRYLAALRAPAGGDAI